MLNYFRTLPDQPLSTRRRFVVFATAFSFALILLLWIGITFFGGRSAEEPTPSPTAAGQLPEAPLLVSPAPVESGTPAPTETPLVDVGQISTSLIGAFGKPSPTPTTTP